MFLSWHSMEVQFALYNAMKESPRWDTEHNTVGSLPGSRNTHTLQLRTHLHTHTHPQHMHVPTHTHTHLAVKPVIQMNSVFIAVWSVTLIQHQEVAGLEQMQSSLVRETQRKIRGRDDYSHTPHTTSHSQDETERADAERIARAGDARGRVERESKGGM